MINSFFLIYRTPFESETKKGRAYTYDEFITQGAKKYAVKIDDKIKITVAGVPKSGGKALKSLNEFRDNFVFDFNNCVSPFEFDWIYHLKNNGKSRQTT